MRSSLRALLTLFLLSLFALTASAQELYVSNRPFKGEVVKTGSSLSVEVEALAKALKIDVVVKNGQAFLGEQSVPVSESPTGKFLVSLDEFAEMAGLTVRENKDFGHFDVYASPSVAENGAASDGGAGSVQSSNGFSIKVPADYELVDDPKVMKAFTSMARESSGSQEGAANVNFIVAPKQGTSKTGYLLLMSARMPGPVPSDREAEVARVMTEAMSQKGRVLSGPESAVVGGQQFYKTVLTLPDPKGMQTMETYVRPANDKKLLLMLMIVDTTSTFTNSSPVLRNALKSFR